MSVRVGAHVGDRNFLAMANPFMFQHYCAIILSETKSD